VHEDVVAAVVRLDEAEALGRVEPLHGAGSHVCCLSAVKIWRAPDGAPHQIAGEDLAKSGLDPKNKRGEQPNQIAI
jgi:hypothetical protein